LQRLFRGAKEDDESDIRQALHTLVGGTLLAERNNVECDL
jgi:hypothetical protein